MRTTAFESKPSVEDTGIYETRTYAMTTEADAAALVTRLAALPANLRAWLDSYQAIGENALQTSTAGPASKDARDLLFHLDQVRRDLERSQPESAIFNAIQVGRLIERLKVRPYESFVKHVRKLRARKRESIAIAQAVLAKKRTRAQAIFREWYLDVPRRDRPKKASVEADIARRLNVEFPDSPTSPRTVRAYLKRIQTF